MNAIWASGVRATVPADYVKVFDIPENDKNAVLGKLETPNKSQGLPFHAALPTVLRQQPY